MSDAFGIDLRVLDYHEHGLGSGTEVKAVCYMELKVGDAEIWGVGLHNDIVTSSLRAIVSGINRAKDLA
ncbi:MAG: alpha-isopropylmalate synthase regulatory domain-containing protein [Acidimicrobiales bacterium]